MSIQLAPATKALIWEQVDSGRSTTADAVIEAAVRLLAERDRRLTWLRAELAIGEEQERRGELIDFTPELLEQLSREADQGCRQAVG